MSDKTIITGVLMDEEATVSFIEVREKFNVSEELLFEMIEHGLFETRASNLQKIQFDQKMLRRIQSACRLQDDLGINIAGAVLALELMEELEQVRNELRILQHHVDMP